LSSADRGVAADRPRRTGPGKETTYESGMMPIGDTHKRFNVRFYVVA